MRLALVPQTHFGAPHDDLHGGLRAIPQFIFYGALAYILALRGLNVAFQRSYIIMTLSTRLAYGRLINDLR